MSWDVFVYFAVPAVICWLGAGIAALRRVRMGLVSLLLLGGLLVFSVFIVGLWRELDRPPMRTMGETRLWYSFFLTLAGYVTYRHWRYPWLPLFSGGVAAVFVVINLAKPEIHSIALMPALQSYYFIPHVTVYIFSYAMLGMATIAAGVHLVKLRHGKPDAGLLDFTDNIVYIGFGFLALGMLTGALWAKEAWGHYWSWDPKETWAFVTGAAYLAYIHIRLRGGEVRTALWLLPIAFVLLMIAWLGVSYLPAAQSSIHVYS